MEKDNELIILWTSGLNKIYIVNLIFKISILIVIMQMLMSIIINPETLNYSRKLLKDSELQFASSLLKEKEFNDAVEGLTIFVGNKKANNVYENIFIRDDGKILSNIGDRSSTIIAKSGYLNSNEKSLVLLNGSIQRLDKDGKINVFKFDKTQLNLSGISTKTISEPKMQETSTLKILNCIKNNYMSYDMHNCTRTKKSYMDTKIEINKRFGTPFYIPLIALICSFILTSRKDQKIYNYKKHIYFFISFIILITAEVIVRYSGISWSHSAIYYLIPAFLLPIIYLMLNKTFKYENLS
jgi:lipopolysaccharide export system permease protein